MPMIHETEIALVIRRVSSKGFLLVLLEVGTFLEGLLSREHTMLILHACVKFFASFSQPSPSEVNPPVTPSLMYSINSHTRGLSCKRAGGYFTSESLPARIAAHNESAGLCLPWMGLPKTLTWFPLPPLSFHCEEPNGLWMQYSATG